MHGVPWHPTMLPSSAPPPRSLPSKRWVCTRHLGLSSSSGFPDSAQHGAVVHGPGLGHAVPVQLHAEDPGRHGHVEPFLLLRQRVHWPVDLGDVSFRVLGWAGAVLCCRRRGPCAVLVFKPQLSR